MISEQITTTKQVHQSTSASPPYQAPFEVITLGALHGPP